MGNFTGAELDRAGKSRGLTGWRISRSEEFIRVIRTRVISPRYINELEQLLVDKIWPFFQDLVSGPTCVLELK